MKDLTPKFEVPMKDLTPKFPMLGAPTKKREPKLPFLHSNLS
mgnify:FL=1